MRCRRRKDAAPRCAGHVTSWKRKPFVAAKPKPPSWPLGRPRVSAAAVPAAAVAPAAAAARPSRRGPIGALSIATAGSVQVAPPRSAAPEGCGSAANFGPFCSIFPACAFIMICHVAMRFAKKIQFCTS